LPNIKRVMCYLEPIQFNHYQAFHGRNNPMKGGDGAVSEE
jgi:hypothetical protein